MNVYFLPTGKDVDDKDLLFAQVLVNGAENSLLAQRQNASNTPKGTSVTIFHALLELPLTVIFRFSYPVSKRIVYRHSFPP